MQKLNILVLGVGGNVSQGIIKALDGSNLNYKIVGACINRESLGLYLCDAAYISPFSNDEMFMPWLFDVCKQEKIDIILTGVEEIIDSLAAHIREIKEKTNAIFVSGNEFQLLIGRDKLKTCEWLKQNDCEYPMYSASEDYDGIEKLVSRCGFPLIAKPRKGKGSQGLMNIHDFSELEKMRGAKNYVIEQCIGNEDSEHTIACYCDKYGRFVELIIMKRSLAFGTTVKAEVVQNDSIRKEAIKICKALSPVGPLNIQMRMHKDGTPVCFELNIRFSGTTPMRARFGFNDVEALIREHVLNEDISNFFSVTKGHAYRYWNELYIDEKDAETLLKNGKLISVNRIGNFVDGYRGK